MDRRKKINRKTFFKWATVVLVVPMYKIWQLSVDHSKAFAAEPQSLRIDAGLPDGIYFHERVILVKKGVEFRLLSSKCTHLGCKINKSEAGQLVCPCHGSRYDEAGVPVKGPAVDPLPEIPFSVTREEGVLVLKYEI